jgi:cytochrome c biogenesis protein CcdA
MFDTAIPVLGLALVDSINPSALAVALYWLSQPSPVPRVLAYVAGIAITYLVLGVALMLGFGSFAQAFGHWFDHPVALGAQLVLGVAMFGYGVFAPKASASDPPPQRQPSRAGLVGMGLLGVTITAVELTTAFPYFGALALMTSAQLSWPQWLPLLAVYNAIFIAPPLALVALHALAGRRLRERFERWRASLQRGTREAMLWIVALVGMALAVDAFARLKAKPSPQKAAETRAVSVAPRG